MHIGVDASCWANRRGYGRYTRELVTALLAFDRENEYWLFLDAATARQAGDLPERAHRVIVNTSQAATRAASASGHRSLRDLWAMHRAVAKHREHLDVFYFPTVYTFFPIRCRGKIVVTIHDAIAERYPALIFPHWRARWLWTLKVRWALRLADLVLTVSDAAKADVAATLRVPEAQIRVVPDAVDEAFHPLHDGPSSGQTLAKFGLEPRHRMILYVGGLSPHKHVDTLIDAFAGLRSSDGFGDARLVLVGDFQHDAFYSSYRALRRMVDDLGLAGRVIFTGFIEDRELVQFYNAARVCVLPSVEEGFGLPALEAMACGIPVIASATPALREVVADAGLFFNPRAAGELTDRLREILTNPRLPEQLGQRGLARARQFSWKRSAEAALAAFHEVAQRDRRPSA